MRRSLLRARRASAAIRSPRLHRGEIPVQEMSVECMHYPCLNGRQPSRKPTDHTCLRRMCVDDVRLNITESSNNTSQCHYVVDGRNGSTQAINSDGTDVRRLRLQIVGLVVSTVTSDESDVEFFTIQLANSV